MQQNEIEGLRHAVIGGAMMAAQWVRDGGMPARTRVARRY